MGQSTIVLVGLLFCVPVGILFVLIATEVVGLFFGVASYVLGARRLGLVTVLVCTAAMFLGLLVAQGVIPGSYDRAVDGFFRASAASSAILSNAHPLDGS